MKTKNDTDNRVIFNTTTIKNVRVVRGHEGWAYCVQIEFMDLKGKRADDDTIQEIIITPKWLTIMKCSSKTYCQAWLGQWVNKDVRLPEDDKLADMPTVQELSA
jgi:hypothetical protein